MLSRDRSALIAGRMMAFLGALVLGASPTVAAAAVWKMALPGYEFQFPRDHASHNEYKTEWWYYTGHLLADDGSKYGYELTFFRIGMDVPGAVKASTWSVRDAYMAHFAVSDMANRCFFHTQRLSRAGVGFAGADQDRFRVYNRNWSAQQSGKDQRLRAAAGGYSIDLDLRPDKPPVIHGEKGVSQKAGCVGCASHYYSFTRLIADGELIADGKRKHVKGITWMDHEFGSNQLTKDQVGWDWFSIQLNDRTELMLYVMRKKDGTLDEHSSGTLVEPDGSSRHLMLSDYRIEHTGKWHSTASGATYPMGFKVDVPSRKLSLTITPDLEDQELNKHSARDVTYWEGSCAVRGTEGGEPMAGQAYVEMTGYASAFSKDI